MIIKPEKGISSRSGQSSLSRHKGILSLKPGQRQYECRRNWDSPSVYYTSRGWQGLQCEGLPCAHSIHPTELHCWSFPSPGDVIQTCSVSVNWSQKQVCQLWVVWTGSPTGNGHLHNLSTAGLNQCHLQSGSLCLVDVPTHILLRVCFGLLSDPVFYEVFQRCLSLVPKMQQDPARRKEAMLPLIYTRHRWMLLVLTLLTFVWHLTPLYEGLDFQTNTDVI